MIKLNFIQFY